MRARISTAEHYFWFRVNVDWDYLSTYGSQQKVIRAATAHLSGQWNRPALNFGFPTVVILVFSSINKRLPRWWRPNHMKASICVCSSSLKVMKVWFRQSQCLNVYHVEVTIICKDKKAYMKEDQTQRHPKVPAFLNQLRISHSGAGHKLRNLWLRQKFVTEAEFRWPQWFK